MQSVDDAISSIPKDDAGKAVLAEFLKGIRENQYRTEERLVKTAGLLLSLAIVCELLSQAAVSEVSVLGLKLTNLVLVRKFLPIGLAYVFYSHLALLALRRLLLECHWHATKAAQPQIFENGLWRFLNPPSSFETESIFESRTAGALKAAISNLSVPLMIALTIGPILYIIYAYFRLFGDFGLTEPLLWVSATVSAFFTLQGFLFFIGTNIVASA